MSRFPLHILIYVLLLTGLRLSGCTDGVTSDRLEQLDSLCLTAPDSASVLLRSMPGDSLRSDADRAYHALLVTQADYKAYIPATSDSLIGIAMDYYEHHHSIAADDERYLRAQVYHGTVAEELGQPDEAIKRYLKAVNYAAEDNHYWRGYIEMRIAKLYQAHYDINGNAIAYYRKAVANLEKAGSSNYLLSCYSGLSETYLVNDLNLDSSFYYVDKALSLSLANNDTASYNMNLIGRCAVLFERGQYEACASLADSLLTHSAKLSGTPSLYLYCYAGRSYTKVGDLSMARHYITSYPTPVDTPDSVHCAVMKREFYKATGQVDSALYYVEQSNRISGNALETSLRLQLKNTEEQSNLQQLRAEKALTQRQLWASIAIALALLLALILIMYHHRVKSKDLQNRLIIAESAIESMEQNDIAKKLLADELILMSQTIGAFAEIDTQKKLSKAMNQAIKYLNSLKQPNNKFWLDLESYVNLTYNNVLAEYKQKFPHLNDEDFQMICMDFARFSTSAYMLFFRLSKRQSVYNRRQSMIKKMKQVDPQFDYIREIKRITDSDIATPDGSE